MPQKELPIRIGMSSMEEKKETAGMTHLHRFKKKKKKTQTGKWSLAIMQPEKV